MTGRISFTTAIIFSPGVVRLGTGQVEEDVLRAGAGLFYDRTGPGPLFDLKRYNGVKLRQIVVTDPSYPSAIDTNLAAQPPTLAHWDPTVKMPYTAQFSSGIERQLYKGTTLTATYWATRGMGLFRSRDVNAPPPPVYLTRPNPAIGIYRQIESSGRLQSDALEISFRGRITSRFNGMVQYTFGRALNDVAGNYSASTRGSGINSFPANNYDLSGEWGRADYDQRHRLNLLGTIHAAKFIDLGVGLFANSGAPIRRQRGTTTITPDMPTLGRRAFHAIRCRAPTLSNSTCDGRMSSLFNARKESPRLTAAVDAFNVTNRVNYTTYVGNLSSPFFGTAVSARPPRRLQLSLRFAF